MIEKTHEARVRQVGAVIKKTRDQVKDLRRKSMRRMPTDVVRRRFKTPLGPVALEGDREEISGVLNSLEATIQDTKRFSDICQKMAGQLKPDDTDWFQRIMSECVDHWGVHFDPADHELDRDEVLARIDDLTAKVEHSEAELQQAKAIKSAIEQLYITGIENNDLAVVVEALESGEPISKWGNRVETKLNLLCVERAKAETERVASMDMSDPFRESRDFIQGHLDKVHEESTHLLEDLESEDEGIVKDAEERIAELALKAKWLQHVQHKDREAAEDAAAQIPDRDERWVVEASTTLLQAARVCVYDTEPNVEASQDQFEKAMEKVREIRARIVNDGLKIVADKRIDEAKAKVAADSIYATTGSAFECYKKFIEKAQGTVENKARGKKFDPDDLAVAENLLQFDSTLYEFDAGTFPSVNRVKAFVGRALAMVDESRRKKDAGEDPSPSEAEKYLLCNGLSIIRKRYPLHFLSREIVEIIENTEMVEGEDDWWVLEDLPLPFDSMCIMLPRGTTIAGSEVEVLCYSRESPDPHDDRLLDTLCTVGMRPDGEGFLCGADQIQDGKIDLVTKRVKEEDPANLPTGVSQRKEDMDKVYGILHFIYKLVCVLDAAPDLITPEKVIKSLKTKRKKKAKVQPPRRLLVAPRFIGKDYQDRTTVAGGQPKGGTHASPRIHWRKRHMRNQRHGHQWEVKNAESDKPKASLVGTNADGTTYRYHKIIVDRKLINAEEKDKKEKSTA